MEQTLRAIELSRRSMESMWTKVPSRTVPSYDARSRNTKSLQKIQRWRASEPSVHIPKGRKRKTAPQPMPQSQSIQATADILRKIAMAKGSKFVGPSREVVTPASRLRLARLSTARMNAVRAARQRARRRAAERRAEKTQPELNETVTSGAAHDGEAAAPNADSGSTNGVQQGGRSLTADDNRVLSVMKDTLPSVMTHGAKSTDDVIRRVRELSREVEGRPARGRIRPVYRSQGTAAEAAEPQVSPAEQLRQDKLALAQLAIPSADVLRDELLSQLGDQRLGVAAAMDQLTESEDALLAFADFLIESGAPGTEDLKARAAALANETGGSTPQSSLEGIVSAKQLQAVTKYSKELRAWESKCQEIAQQYSNENKGKSVP